MQGEENDDDYMGDMYHFLPPDEIAIPQTKKNEVESKGYKRKLNWKEKRKIKREDQQKEEDEHIKMAFNSPIPSTNIGFKMLQQMGYNTGVALGKQGQGILEPVRLEIKRSRTGLGRDQVEEKQIQKSKKMERIIPNNKMKEASIMLEYGERKKFLWQSRKILVNYKKAKAALSQLEEAKFGHPTNIEKEQGPDEDTGATVADEEEEVTAEKEYEGEYKGYKRKLNWKEKRKITREDQQKEEDERIKKAFNSAIPSTNIGFKMLQQMGYNPGVALGKQGQGSLEPVSLEIKRSRSGLGRDQLEKEKQIQKVKEKERIIQKNKMKEASKMPEYGEKKEMLWQSPKTVVNYEKVKAALSQLKKAKFGHPRSVEKVKWLDEDTGETVEDEEEEVTAEDLQEVLDRLRTEFHYCFYCGCQYESEDAMLSNCPGTEEENH